VSCLQAASGGPPRLGGCPDPDPDFAPRGFTENQPRAVSAVRNPTVHREMSDGSGELRPVTPALEPLRRIAAYAICRGSAGQVLLVRASPRSGTAGIWSLPVARSTTARTRTTRCTGDRRGDRAVDRGEPGWWTYTPTCARCPTAESPSTPTASCTRTCAAGSLIDRVGQADRPWPAGSTRRRRPSCRCARSPPARSICGGPAVDLRPDEPPDFPSFPRGTRTGRAAPGTALRRVRRGHRPGRPDLLTRIAEGYPGGGRGTCPAAVPTTASSPGAALIRELAEETGQRGRLVELLGVASHPRRGVVAPRDTPIDWHGVRAFYRVARRPGQRSPGTRRGRSTAEARWFTHEEIAGLDLTEVTTEVLGSVADRRSPSDSSVVGRSGDRGVRGVHDARGRVLLVAGLGEDDSRITGACRRVWSTARRPATRCTGVRGGDRPVGRARRAGRVTSDWPRSRARARWVPHRSGHLRRAGQRGVLRSEVVGTSDLGRVGRPGRWVAGGVDGACCVLSARSVCPLWTVHSRLPPHRCGPARHARAALRRVRSGDRPGRTGTAEQDRTGLPGRGRWHLPGGGTDFGEQATDGLVREIAEETDQRAG